LPEQYDIARNISGDLLNISGKRAIFLLKNYLTVENTEFNQENLAEQVDFGKGKILFKSCNDDFCEAFVEYDITRLTEKLNAR